MKLLNNYSLFACMLICVIVGTLGGCKGGDDADNLGSYERIVRDIMVEFEQSTAVRSSVLHFRLRGTNRLVAESASLQVVGETHDGRIIRDTFFLPTKRDGDVGDLYLELPVEQNLWSHVNPSPSGYLSANFSVELSDAIGVLARGHVANAKIQFESTFAPTIEPFSVGQVHVNEHIEVRGTAFLRPEEGRTWAVVESGEVTYADGTSRTISGEKIAIVWSDSRTVAKLPLEPAVFGVQVANFMATIQFENELSTGETFSGNRVEHIQGSIQPTYIAALTPDGGSRGQKISISGRGFVPTATDASYTMTFRYEGVFTPSDASIAAQEFKDEHAPERVPDRVLSEQLAEQNVWYAVRNRQLEGLGANPGTFEGTITPILIDNYGEQVGIPWEGTFAVLPTKQVVYLKYLPAFSKGLEKYGLENVERPIRDRILEVVHRDYYGINIEFREQEPDDFIDYATVEMGGPDPSGNNAFGYDNTFNEDAKDTGNLYLADYLGGVNAASAAEFNNPYGGIFIESFSFFSPTLTPGNEFASPEFDRILGPFMPALGGQPVRATEWPDGHRRQQIREAIHMVGNVIANTVSHEIGHSLGLTFYPEDWFQPGRTFHNRVPSDCIMDAGADRSFEQRAELDGHGHAKFNERNIQYLKQILPLP